MRAQQGHTVVLGVRDGNVLPRLELRELQADADLWNLYLLGLRNMQDRPQVTLDQDRLSFYGVAAVHSRPWGTPQFGLQPTQPNAGFAAHTSNLFGSWHRCYLALYEQTLHAVMQEVATTFPDSRYTDALTRFRIPFLDLAAPPGGKDVWPAIMSDETVDVDTPQGRQTIPNPLFSFKFNPIPSVDVFGWAPWTYWPKTLRYPSSGAPDARSQNDLVRRQLEANSVSFRDRIYALLTSYDNYNQFILETWDRDAGREDSLPALHGAIHFLVGNAGHFTWLDHSAYDPFFALLHTFIDRVDALWTARHPQSYIQPAPVGAATAMYPAGTVTDENTDLAPFFSDNQTMWKSHAVRYTHTFGYYYNDANHQDPNVVGANIARLYGPQSSVTRKRDGHSTKTDEPCQLTHDYFVNIRVDKFALQELVDKAKDPAQEAAHSLKNEAYAVYVFIKEPPANPAEWAFFKDGLVGTHGIVMPTMNDHPMSLVIGGSLPLNTRLREAMDRGDLSSLEPPEVGRYLEKIIHWKVATAGDAPIEIKDVKGLKISVLTSLLRNPCQADSLHHREGPVEGLPDATSGKEGGAQPGDVDV